MSKHQTSLRNRKRFRRRRRIGIWFTKFLGWLMLMLVLGMGLIALIGFIAYQHRVRVVNDALATLVDPYHVELQSIDFEKLGVARVKGVTLTPKFVDREFPLAYLEEVLITYDFDTIRHSGKLKSITIEKPTVHLDEKMFEAFTASDPDKNSEEPSPQFDLEILSRFTDSFDAREGRLILDLPWHPPVTTAWEFHSGPIQFDDKGLLVTPLELDLRDLRFGERGEAGHIERFFVKTRINRNLSHIEVDDLLIEKPEITFTPAWLSPVKQDPASPSIQEGQVNDPTGLNQSAETEISPFVLVFNRAKINEADLSVLGFDEEKARGLVPDLKLSGALNLEDIALRNGKWSSREEIFLDLEHFFVGAGDEAVFEGRPIHLSADSLQDLIENQRIKTLKVGEATISVSDKSLSRFKSDHNDDPNAELSPAGIGSVIIEKGTFTMKDFAPGGKEMPEVQTGFSGELRQLQFGKDGLSSKESQHLTLEDFSLRAPGASGEFPDFLKISHADARLTLDEFNRSGRIESLTVEGPEIRFTDETLGKWAALSEDESAAGPANRPVYSADQLEINSGLLITDTKFADNAVPKVISNFSLTTLPDSPDPTSPAYHLVLSDIRLRNHARITEDAAVIEKPNPNEVNPSADAAPLTQTVVEEEVLTVKEISADFTAKQLQRDRRIEKIKVDGATLNVGHGLKELVREGEKSPEEETPTETPEPTTPQAAAPGKKPLPTWRIGEIEVTNSQVRFEALIPQIEGLQFALETRLTDVPLSIDGLLAQEQKQKIELSGIEIKDPYDSFITVAYLPTIFVEFSLSGLAKQEIEKIDLIGPSLYVGQGLFWWIEYQRKFREQNEGASVGLKGENSPIQESPDWVIKKINATTGKIVIAPTGVPIGMVPFPFNAETSMDGGKISLKLNIPGEEYVYRFPDYKVDLYGLNGKVDFNVPVEDVNNNLVQTFDLKKAVWKKYEAKDLYLSVTFDTDGVYGEFGGAAYDGYVKGQFNYYLTEDGKKWDGWITGTDLDTGPLTKVIVPDSFLMDGRINIDLITVGDGSTVGETTGSITTKTPGWIDITKLDKMLEELPSDWSNLQRSLAELGLIGLKKFEYDKGTGSLYFKNREGDLNLRLEGPYGSRELNIHLHDWRNETEKANGALTAGP